MTKHKDTPQEGGIMAPSILRADVRVPRGPLTEYLLLVLEVVSKRRACIQKESRALMRILMNSGQKIDFYEIMAVLASALR